MPTYPLSFPPIAPATERLVLYRKQQAMSSPFSGATQVVEGFAQWRLTFLWPRMNILRARAASGWLNSLAGQRGSFLYRPAASGLPLPSRSTVGSTPHESTAMTIGGWGAGAASFLTAGTFFSVGDQLLQITSAPLAANGSGQVTIEFQPFLRATYANGTTVNFTGPTGLFRLDSGDLGGYSIDCDYLPEFAPVAAIEVL